MVITTRQNLERLKTMEIKSQDRVTSTHYTVAPITGKGLGLLANQTLRRGDVVMRQTPALLVHRTFLEQTPPHRQNALLDEAVSLLPAPLRELFLSQAGQTSGAAHKVSDILATNSFQMDLGLRGAGDMDTQHYGNFPEVSRLNHDCRPNVAFRIEPSTLTHVTTVVRDRVNPGEELTISYLSAFEPRAARQHRAKLAWGFECSCSQCALPAPLAKKSDNRLAEIVAIEAKLSDITTGKREVTPKLLKRLVRLYEEERLDANLAGAYTLIALNYNMLGDDKNAAKFARLAKEALLIENGDGSGDVGAMEALARNPREHFTWRRRLS